MDNIALHRLLSSERQKQLQSAQLQRAIDDISCASSTAYAAVLKIQQELQSLKTEETTEDEDNPFTICTAAVASRLAEIDQR